jgi:hypothetical protein
MGLDKNATLPSSKLFSLLTGLLSQRNPESNHHHPPLIRPVTNPPSARGTLSG